MREDGVEKSFPVITVWHHDAWAVPERGSDPPPPLKNYKKYIGFLNNTGPDPLKNHKNTVSEHDQEIPQSQTADNPMTPRGRATQGYQASIQFWAIIGTPAKRHLNGVSLAGR